MFSRYKKSGNATPIHPALMTDAHPAPARPAEAEVKPKTTLRKPPNKS